MGLIHGVYDAKPKGFVPRGSSLHNCLSGHGPDAETFKKASVAELKPHYQEGLAFMFESRYVFYPTPFALEGGLLQGDYLDCWKGIENRFVKK
jgi:homogentisate 1,2-dioxygenase